MPSDPPQERFSLRVAQPADIPALVALEDRSVAHCWPPGAFEQELTLPHAQLWVAQDQEAGLVGFASFHVVAGEVSLLNIVVAPGHRRRGIGKALLDLVEERGRGGGGDAVFLEVRASNEAALVLYLGRGYQQVGIRKAYYSDNGEDALVLSLALDPDCPDGY